jgi:hypothetical protein
VEFDIKRSRLAFLPTLIRVRLEKVTLRFDDHLVWVDLDTLLDSFALCYGYRLRIIDFDVLRVPFFQGHLLRAGVAGPPFFPVHGWVPIAPKSLGEVIF